jgi:hypothetical protein
MNEAYKLTKREQYVIDHPNMSWEVMAIANNTSIYRMQQCYETGLLKLAKAMALREINQQRTANGKLPLLKVERQWWSIYGNDYRQRIINS